MAKGKRNVATVIVTDGITLTHNGILISGFIVSVSYVYAFLVDNVRIRRIGKTAFLPTAVNCGGKVYHRGRRVVVIAICNDQRTGGADLIAFGINAGEKIAYRLQTGLANATYPHNGINAVRIALKEVHLKRVRRINKHNELFENALIFKSLDIAKHILLIFIKLKIVILSKL